MNETPETEISQKLIEETTEKYIKSLNVFGKGGKIALFAGWNKKKAYSNIPRGESTKIDIISEIEREVREKASMHEKYRLEIRKKIIEYIKGNWETEKKFNQAVKRLSRIEAIASSRVIGTALKKMNEIRKRARDRKKRNLRNKRV
ncbi:MAG: hypothetical protein ABH986_00115 [archaeon]